MDWIQISKFKNQLGSVDWRIQWVKNWITDRSKPIQTYYKLFRSAGRPASLQPDLARSLFVGFRIKPAPPAKNNQRRGSENLESDHQTSHSLVAIAPRPHSPPLPPCRSHIVLRQHLSTEINGDRQQKISSSHLSPAMMPCLLLAMLPHPRIHWRSPNPRCGLLLAARGCYFFLLRINDDQCPSCWRSAQNQNPNWSILDRTGLDCIFVLDRIGCENPKPKWIGLVHWMGDLG